MQLATLGQLLQEINRSITSVKYDLRGGLSMAQGINEKTTETIDMAKLRKAVKKNKTITETKTFGSHLESH